MLGSTVLSFIFWRATHAWLIYILLYFGVHIHIVDSSIYLVLRFLLLVGAQHMLGLFIFCFILACTYILLTRLFIWFYAFCLLAHNTCLAYLYFAFGIRFWRTHLGLLIFYCRAGGMKSLKGTFFGSYSDGVTSEDDRSSSITTHLQTNNIITHQYY